MNNQQAITNVMNILDSFSTATNTEQINAVDEQIKQILSEKTFALQVLFHIINTPKMKTTIVGQAIVLLKKIATDISEANQQQTEFMATNLISIIFSSDFDLKIKKQMTDVLKIVISPPLIDSELNQALQVKNYAFKKIGDINLDQLDNDPNRFSTIIGIFLVFKAIFKSTHHTANINKLFNENFPAIFSLYSLIVEKAITALAGPKFNKSTINDPEVTRLCNENLAIILNYSQLIKIIFKSMEKLKMEKLSTLANNPAFIKSMISIICVKVGNLTLNIKNVLFNSTGLENLNEMLNKIKSKTLYTFKQLFTIYRKSGATENRQLEVQYKLIGNTITESLITFYKKSQMTHEMIRDDNDLRPFIKICCKYLLSSISHPAHFDIYTTNKKFLIKDVILPNTVASSSEKDNLEDNPSEFVHDQADFLVYKRGKTLKNLMNKLLLTMCTDIDGVLTYIVSILIELMSFHCKNESVENLANYRALSELVDSKFFKDEDKEAQFEASLLILGSLVPKIKLRLDLINLFMSFLKNTIQIMAGGADIIKVRLIGFISIFLETIPIYNKEQGTMDFVNHIYEWLLKQLQGSPVTSMAAIKALELIMRNDKKIKTNARNVLCQDLSNDFFLAINQQLVSSNPNGPLKLMFSFINQNQGFFDSRPENLKSLVTNTVSCLQVQISQNDNRNKMLLINNAWNCMKVICARQNLVNLHFAFIVEKLAPFLQYIMEQRHVDWDEDLYNCYLNLIKIKKELPTYTPVLFDSFFVLQQLNKGKMTISLNLLSLLISEFPSSFNPQQIALLFNGLKLALDPTTMKDHLLQVAPEGLILLHVMIQHLGDKFTDQQILTCFEYYNNFRNIIEAHEDRDLAQSYLIDKNEGILLSMFFKIPEKTFAFLGQDIVQYISKIIDNSIFFETTYECKLLMFGLLNLFHVLVKSRQPQYDEALFTLFDFIIVYMKFIQNQELIWFYEKIAETRKLSNYERQVFNLKEALVNYLPFDEDRRNFWFEVNNFYENQYQYTNDEIDLYDIMNADMNIIREKELQEEVIESVIMDMDEYKHLRQIIKAINQEIPGLISNIIKRSPNLVQNNIKDVVFKTEYFELTNQKNVTVKKLRKIARLKRVK